MNSEKALEVLRGVKHPENKRSIVDLGMVKSVDIRDSELAITLALPYKDVPVKERLLRDVRNAAETVEPNLKVDITVTEMSQRERAAFMSQADGGPKPAQSGNIIGNVIAVLSGKGGVGKSSSAALLAVALNRRGHKVGVLDADITGPSIPKMFSLHKPPVVGRSGLLPVRTKSGIEVMSINLLLQGEDHAVIWRGPRISGAIKQFWQEVYWGELDYLIVDLPPGTSDASLTVMQSIPLSGILLVTSPQDLAGMVVRKAARMAQQLGAPILGVVENMSHVLCPKCGEQIEPFGPSKSLQMARELGVPLLGRLPLDPTLAVRCDTGEVEAYKTDDFESIAETVAKRLSVLSNGGAFG